MSQVGEILRWTLQTDMQGGVLVQQTQVPHLTYSVTNISFSFWNLLDSGMLNVGVLFSWFEPFTTSV